MKHSNAIGYILELKSLIRQNWFDGLIEYALADENTTLTSSQAELLYQELISPSEYIEKSIFAKEVTQNSTTAIARELLVALYNFDNFKKLEQSLKVGLHPRATIIFGANGAGKSSLCAAFKCLAGESQREPLHNVHGLTTDCSFEYDTENEQGQKWESKSPEPKLSSHIKFFDSKLALTYVESNSDPRQYIEITPYLLHLFELLKIYLDEFEAYSGNKLRADENAKLSSMSICNGILGSLKSSVAQNFTNALSSENLAFFDDYIAKLDGETIGARLAEAKAIQKKYLAAIDENGQKLLKLRVQSVRAWIAAIKGLCDDLKNVDINSYIEQIISVGKKSAEQRILIERVVPHHQDIEGFKRFLDASKTIFNYDGSEKYCPFCKREFSKREIALVREYANFLISDLEKEILNLKNSVAITTNILIEIKKRDYTSLFNEKCVSDELRGKVIQIISALLSGIDVILSTPSTENAVFWAVAQESICQLITQAEGWLKPDLSLLESASANADEQMKRRRELQQTIDNLELENTFSVNLNAIQNALSNIRAYNQHKQAIDAAAFANIRRQLSNKSKQAFSELIVPQFEENLNAEYLRLAERAMSSFGIEFVNKASEGNVSLMPKVKSKRIDVVLSEGELKIHALALFFTELKYAQEDIIIFDDPINSLDEKYSLSVVDRIRDCIKENPQKQVIVLTHNYGFFIQLIQRFGQSSLGRDFSSLILESCGILEPHTEKIEDLEAKIENGLRAMPFDKETKDHLAKYMRLYIESIVNHYVFNQCRRTYNPHTEVSVFHKYMGVTPLTQDEATALSDIYSRVSPWEHDDYRTSYLNSDKDTFQTRYDKIKIIKEAIIARKKQT